MTLLNHYIIINGQKINRQAWQDFFNPPSENVTMPIRTLLLKFIRSTVVMNMKTIDKSKKMCFQNI